MPFPKEFTNLINKIENMPTEDFKQRAKEIIENNPSIITDKEEQPKEFGLEGSPIILDALSCVMILLLDKRKQTDKTKDFSTFTHEENIVALATLLLEKGANPNFIVDPKKNLTAAEMFMKFLDRHLTITGTAVKLWSGNTARDVLSPYVYLMQLFVKQQAEFKVDLAKCNFANMRAIMDLVQEVKSYIAELKKPSSLSVEVLPPTPSLHM